MPRPFLVLGVLAAPLFSQLAFDPPIAIPAGVNPRCVRAADIDGDLDKDLVVSSEGSHDVRIFKNDGNGGFALTQTISIPGVVAATWVILAPLDTDIDLDLVVTYRDSNVIGVFLNNGAGMFVPSAGYVMPGGPVSAVAADFDNDSWIDLAVANEAAGVVSILLNTGIGGTFGFPTDVPSGFWPVAVDAGDFNGDGFMDLAVSHLLGGTVAVLMNGGMPSPGTFTNTGSLTSGGGSFGIVTGRFDAGPTLDLAVANVGGSVVVVFTGSGAGTFAPAPLVPTGAGPTSLVTRDFDGDGLADLATSDTTSGTLSILRQSPAGTFAAPLSFPAGPGSVNVDAADLDGDGDFDLLSADHAAAGASVVFRTLLGAAGFGNVGAGAGGPYDHLFVNGSSGGRDRRVNVGINQPVTISLTQPPSNPNPTDFVLFGQFGIPNPFVDTNALPFGIGTACIRFCLLYPGALDLFLLANSYGSPVCGPPIFTSAPGAWSSVPVFVPIQVAATFQGVIFETPSSIRVTNAVVLSVN